MTESRALADRGAEPEIRPPVSSHSTLIPVVLALLLAAPLPLAAQDDASSGLVGLSLPIGARVVGQGRAAAGASGELQALPYNPAATFGMDGVMATYSRFQAASATDVNGNYLAIGGPTRWGVVTLHAIYLDYGDIPVTDASPTPIGSIEVSDWAVGVTWSNQWREKLAYGATVKWLNADLGTISAGGPAVDAGLIYEPKPSLPLALAVSLRNLGPDLDFGGDESDGTDHTEALPSRVRLGLHYHPATFPGLSADYRLAFSFDIESVLNELATSSQHAGAAVTVYDVVVVRGGFLLVDNPFDAGGGRANRNTGGTLGVGVRVGDFEADLAREISVSELGDETHISVSYRF